MPIYEYECESCQKTFEQLVFKDIDEKPTCPCCGSTQTRKLISCASFLGSSGAGTCLPSAPSKGFS
jgi:putative FmdB family regulatory protein